MAAALSAEEEQVGRGHFRSLSLSLWFLLFSFKNGRTGGTWRWGGCSSDRPPVAKLGEQRAEVLDGLCVGRGCGASGCTTITSAPGPEAPRGGRVTPSSPPSLHRPPTHGSSAPLQEKAARFGGFTVMWQQNHQAPWLSASRANLLAAES